MKRTASKPALLALLIASTLTGAVSLADPLHKYGNEGAWCHVDSGWMFPENVGNFARVLQPYSIDGNSDAAGAEYRQESGPLQGAIEVDVYGIDSMATDAKLDGAKATAAHKVGEGAKIESEQPFKLGAAKDLKGVKVNYAAGANASGRTHLYYFTTDRWHVKVLATVTGTSKESDEELDAFVQALPWNTLGTNPGIH
jgi:hypothetical protein